MPKISFCRNLTVADGCNWYCLTEKHEIICLSWMHHTTHMRGCGGCGDCCCHAWGNQVGACPRGLPVTYSKSKVNAVWWRLAAPTCCCAM
eukprot:scaffold18026_cov34-Prasinocladus_malaysianus.AAC.2